jgi:hypothetical protein
MAALVNREKDRTTIEETFRRLTQLGNSLDEEQKRSTNGQIVTLYNQYPFHSALRRWAIASTVTKVRTNTAAKGGRNFREEGSLRFWPITIHGGMNIGRAPDTNPTYPVPIIAMRILWSQSVQGSGLGRRLAF